MRDFNAIQQQLRLREFHPSRLGTLHYVPDPPAWPKVMVRRFDGELPPRFVNAFVNLIAAAQRWIDRRPVLARLVTIQQPTEVGADFVARPYHMYGSRIYEFDEPEEGLEIPPQLGQMRSAFRAAAAAVAPDDDERDAVVLTVLSRSLMGPSGKTYFDWEDGRFVIVEPEMTAQEVDRWAELAG
jgi:hypothetical protein